MTLPDKAIEAAHDAWEKQPNNFGLDLCVIAAIQAAINALWTPFDPQDPETWPKSEYAPSGKPWLVEFVNGALASSKFRDGHVCDGWWSTVIRYTDPIHITPTETE